MTFKNIVLCSIALSAIATPVIAGIFDKTSSFIDIDNRQKIVQKPEYEMIKKACLASSDMISDVTGKELGQPVNTIPSPITALKSTEGYGSDTALSDFSWYLMVHSGRAVAGDKASIDNIKEALLTWANANALYKTEETHDAYYALKRGLLPVIQSYLVVRDDFNDDENNIIKSWIDPLVRLTDKKFDGDVDHNNHRYLADSVLTLWGDIIGDDELYAKGRERFEIALDQMENDGSLPLETRRGSRALWYMRQSLADLTLIAEIYAQNGDDLYALEKDGKSLSLMMDYYINAVRNPLIILQDASYNHIPGPSDNFFEQDMGMLNRRGTRRHYMAFAEMYLAHYAGTDNKTAKRLKILMDETGFKERPLIDDYIGANVTCLWGQP